MRNRSRRSPFAGAWLVLLACLALAPCGCWLSDQFGPKADVRLGSGHIVILPFATLNKPAFESQLGARFSREVAKMIREGCPRAKVTDPDGILESIREPEAERMTPLAIARRLGADYVMVGEIHELRGKDPKSLNVTKGTMILSSQVGDVRSGKVAWQGERETFHYPPRLLGGEEIPAQLNESEEEVVKKVMAEAARGLAQIFAGRKLRTSEKAEKAFE